MIQLFFSLFSIFTPLTSVESLHTEVTLAPFVKKTTQSSCPKPAANLIVVNFSSGPLTVYVRGKKIGRVPAFNQTKFKQKLPVGSSLVEIKGAANAAQAVSISQVEQITNKGAKTCSISRAILVNKPQA